MEPPEEQRHRVEEVGGGQSLQGEHRIVHEEPATEDREANGQPERVGTGGRRITEGSGHGSAADLLARIPEAVYGAAEARIGNDDAGFQDELRTLVLECCPWRLNQEHDDLQIFDASKVALRQKIRTLSLVCLHVTCLVVPSEDVGDVMVGDTQASLVRADLGDVLEQPVESHHDAPRKLVGVGTTHAALREPTAGPRLAPSDVTECAASGQRKKKSRGAAELRRPSGPASAAPQRGCYDCREAQAWLRSICVL